jgi:chemotaxis protein CheX
MITHEEVTVMIREATLNVFSTMLGLDFETGESYVEEDPPGPSEGVLALIGLAGTWAAGSGTFSCSAEMARKISSALLMTEYESINDEVLDAIGEVANMVVGNVKTSLEEKLGPMGLSIPTVVYGRNFTTRSMARSSWTVVPFKLAGDSVHVHLCLAPTREPARLTTSGEQGRAVLTLMQ